MKIPDEVSRVDGCSCRGVQYHRADCTIFDLELEDAIAATEQAEQRIQAYTDRLNERGSEGVMWYVSSITN
jgi:hypothetical protein